MKRIYISIILFCFVPLIGISQNTNNTVVIYNNNTTSIVQAKSGKYYINGVSSSEDVGGVEVYAISEGNSKTRRLKFTNFNDFNVSVLYEVFLSNSSSNNKKTSTIVLEAGESKITNTYYNSNDDFRLIVRRMGKIKETIVNEHTELKVYGGYFITYPQQIPCEGRAKVSNTINSFNQRKVYGHTNWRLPSDTELYIIGINNSDEQIYTSDNWNRGNIHPSLLLLVCEK